tara:strand:+ start:73 stop:549 length:477 start_codon:yes stop_codon:yes gene_type:complete
MFGTKKKQTLTEIDKYDSIIDEINRTMTRATPGCTDKLHLDEKINKIESDDETKVPMNIVNQIPPQASGSLMACGDMRDLAGEAQKSFNLIMNYINNNDTPRTYNIKKYKDELSKNLYPSMDMGGKKRKSKKRKVKRRRKSTKKRKPTKRRKHTKRTR